MLLSDTKNRQFPFWLFMFSIATGLTLPILIQDGMFMDAMLYTSVSHNLSEGIGSFWYPQFSDHNVAGLPSFHEQPPLVFGIQSLFFRVLGDSMYVERFYTFLTMCSTIFLISYFWKYINRQNTDIKSQGWLPALLWITVPVCFWSYSNNMHENTMSIFTLSAVIFIFKALEKPKNDYINLTTGGLFVVLSCLCKGIPGLFPLTVPFLYWLTLRKFNFGKMVMQSVLLSLAVALFFGLLLLIPDARGSLEIYFFKRALHRINEVPTVDNRFYILGRLLSELLPQLALATLAITIARVKRGNLPSSDNIRKAIFFGSIGLAASAPLMLTMVQKGFYFVPALPFFGISIAFLIAPVISAPLQSISARTNKVLLLSSISLLIISLAISFMQVGKSSRNGEMLHDVYEICKIVPAKTTVSIPAENWNQWDMQCYLIRYHNISVDGSNLHEYFIAEKTQQAPPGYLKLEYPTLSYDIYKKSR